MYYCLFNCDEWKSSNSMNLLMVTNDKLKLSNVIKNEIINIVGKIVLEIIFRM